VNKTFFAATFEWRFSRLQLGKRDKSVVNDNGRHRRPGKPDQSCELKARILDVAPGCRTSSRPAEIWSASKGRTYDRSRPNRSKRQNRPCHPGPSTYDDWGPETLTPEQARDLLEIVEDRYDVGSVMITSQIPVDRWHDMIGVPTLADAILDRVIHNAYRIDLSGDSLRKQRSSS
jgi:hypothetical protein